MTLNDVEHKLTISEIASVYAVQEVNRLKIRASELQKEYVLISHELESKLKLRLREIFESSQYFEPFKLLFGNDEPNFHYVIKDIKENTGLIEFGQLPVVYLNDVSKEDSYTILIRLVTASNKDVKWLELEEKLVTVGFGCAEKNSVKSEMTNIDTEIRKDWEKIFTTHFIAKKMADMGLNESISIPELPKIELNSSLS